MSIKNLQKKWYVIGSESKGAYSEHDPIKFLTKFIESILCDYSDAYILVTGDIAAPRILLGQVVILFEESNHFLQPHKYHLKIVHHLKTAEQKLMVRLLTKQILLILQCQCTI